MEIYSVISRQNDLKSTTHTDGRLTTWMQGEQGTVKSHHECA